MVRLSPRLALCMLAVAAVPAAALAQDPGVAPRTQGRATAAVQEFEDIPNSGQAAAFREMVETAITQSSRFRLITRNDTGMRRERDGQQSGRLTNRAGSATTEGAQYIVTGTITTASVENRPDLLGGMIDIVGRGENARRRDCYKVRVILTMDVRIQDVRSGLNNAATSVNEQQDSPRICSGQGSQVNLGSLLRNAAQKVAELLVTTVYPVQIMGVQPDGTIILNYGGPFLAQGMELNLYGPATRMVDPATGEERLIDSDAVGRVRVFEVTQTHSRARPVGRLAIPPRVGGVARPVQNTGRRR